LVCGGTCCGRGVRGALNVGRGTWDVELRGGLGRL
jgi:hypothetical protein